MVEVLCADLSAIVACKGADAPACGLGLTVSVAVLNCLCVFAQIPCFFSEWVLCKAADMLQWQEVASVLVADDLPPRVASALWSLIALAAAPTRKEIKSVSAG